MMIEPLKPPQLTPEQQQALEASNGLLQGDSYVRIRNDVVLDWFGYSLEELQKELQPAIEQAERREFVISLSLPSRRYDFESCCIYSLTVAAEIAAT
jgi:hypothetical protein